jgi:hypothetical protein
MDVNMIMEGLAKMQDDVWAMWNEPERSQQQKDIMIKDFNKFLDDLNKMTSKETIEQEVALQLVKRAKLREKLT